MDRLVLWRARAGVGPGYTVEAAAVRLTEDIAELRADGGIPTHVRTAITVLPQQRVLEIRVEGLSVEADPDRTTIREVTHVLFELAIFRTKGVRFENIAVPGAGAKGRLAGIGRRRQALGAAARRADQRQP